jgi:hypothetical protein
MNTRGEKIDHEPLMLVALVLVSACLWHLFGDWSATASAKETNRTSQKNASVRPDEPFHTRSVVTPAGHLSQKWAPVAAAIRR